MSAAGGDSRDSKGRPSGSLSLYAIRDRVDETLKRRVPPSDALRQLAQEVCGPPGPANLREYRRFYLVASQIARRMALKSPACADLQLPGAMTLKDINACLRWTDTFDRRSALVIDLHYFAGLSVRRTAELLGLAPTAVLRDLRFSRKWFQVRLMP